MEYARLVLQSNLEAEEDQKKEVIARAKQDQLEE